MVLVLLEMKISLFTSISDGLGKNSEMGKVINWDEEKATKGKGREDEGKRERGWGSAVELTLAGHHSLIPTTSGTSLTDSDYERDITHWFRLRLRNDLMSTFESVIWFRRGLSLEPVIVRLLRDCSENICRHIITLFNIGFHHGPVVTRVYLQLDCYRFDSPQGHFAKFRNFSISRKIPRASAY